MNPALPQHGDLLVDDQGRATRKYYDFFRAAWDVIGQVSGRVPVNSGGTGIDTYAAGDLIVATGARVLERVASVASGNALISGGVGFASTWGKIGLTTHVSGVLPEPNGGTNQSAYTQGDVLYASAANTLAKLGIGASGRFLQSSGSVPQWTAPAALTKVDDTNITATLGGTPATALMQPVSITLGWSGTLSVARGGTGQGTYTPALMDSALTAGRVPFNTTDGRLTDEAGFEYDAATNRLRVANLRFGTHTGLGGETVTGYMEVMDDLGNTRKVAVVS
jgi:hypothetical protein